MHNAFCSHINVNYIYIINFIMSRAIKYLLFAISFTTTMGEPKFSNGLSLLLSELLLWLTVTISQGDVQN